MAPAASAGTGSAGAPSNAAGLPVIKVAAHYRGVPYRWGGTSTHGFDCSGYVQFVFRKLGVSLPRTAEEQYEAVEHIPRSQLRIGDLVFYGGRRWVYHVGIYAGHGMFWDAPHTGDRVRLQAIWAGSKVYGRVRGLPTGIVVAPALSAPAVPAPGVDAPIASVPTPAPTVPASGVFAPGALAPTVSPPTAPASTGQAPSAPVPVVAAPTAPVAVPAVPVPT